MSRFDDFLNECFDDKGEHDLTKKYNKITINNNCKWCEFKDRPEICDRNMMRLNVRIKLNDFIGNGEEIVVEKLKQAWNQK